MAASAPLRNRLQASSKLELVDTMVDRLAVGGTLRNWAFAATTAHTDPVYDIALLGLVAQPARLVGPGWVWGAGRGARGAVRGAALRADGTASSPPAARPTASSTAPGCTCRRPCRLTLMAALFSFLKFWLHYVFTGMYWYSCPVACGILVPQPKMEPTSPALKG